MEKRTLAERVGILEQKVAILEQLPEHSAINKSLEGLQRLVLLTFPFDLPF